MLRTLAAAFAVAGIAVLSYATAFLFRQILPTLREGRGGIAIFPAAVLALYVVSSLLQALRLSGGRGWILHRILAVTVLVLVVAGCLRGGPFVLPALAIGAAAVPVELYLANATRRGGRDGA